MPAGTINPTTSSVTIFFADPSKPLPSGEEPKRSYAICLDLDSCSREPDGSLGASCRTLLERAEANNVDVILAAKTVKFFEIPGLDKYSVTLVEKPKAEMTGSALVGWVTDELNRVMRLAEGRKRGFQSSKPVEELGNPRVGEAYLQSHLSKEREKAFLHYVSGRPDQPHAALADRPTKSEKFVAGSGLGKFIASSGKFALKKNISTKGKLYAETQESVMRVKAAKAAKALTSNKAASADTAAGHQKKR